MEAEVIQNNPLFRKLKNVVENNSYHNNETVYDHLIKTFNKAVEEISGKMITNPQTKEKFDQFLNLKIGGIKKKELIPLIALTHDIGKMVVFEENGETKSIVQENKDGITNAPGHEYAGFTIAQDLLRETKLPKEAMDYIAKGIRLHGVFNDAFQQNQNATAEELLEIMKQKSEEMHFEMIFNSLCDCYTALPFQAALPFIKEIFNLPQTYSFKKYFIK